jgi:UDP-N-acetylmuramyl pentapeptide phosphotransferase/UDP-N-acetylglucosamine-1-phosphate transferase
MENHNVFAFFQIELQEFSNAKTQKYIQLWWLEELMIIEMTLAWLATFNTFNAFNTIDGHHSC